MNKIVCFLFIIIIVFLKGAYAQDSAEIFFKKQYIFLKTGKLNQASYQLGSSYSETLIEIGAGKYFYVKERNRDTLPIEFGQLRLYNLGGRHFLLREGYWVLENSLQKVLFHNYGRLGLLEEMKIISDKSGYNTQPKSNTKKSIKRSN